MKLVIIVFSFLLILKNTANSQTAGTDSVFIEKLERLVEQCKNFWYVDAALATRFADSVLLISKQHNYSNGEAQAYNLYGVINDVNGDFDQSLFFYKRAHDIYVEEDDQDGQASCQYNIGLVLQQDEQYAEALEYVTKAYQYYVKVKKNRFIAMSAMTIGNLYLTNGKTFDEALAKMKEAETLSIAENDTAYWSYALGLQANAHLTQNKSMDSVIYYFNKSIGLLTIFNPNNHWSLSYSHLGLAKAYLKLGQLERAYTHNQIAMTKNLILNKKLGLKDVYENTKDILVAQGNYPEAIEAYKMFDLYKDSVYSEQRSKQINRIKIEYETDKKEAEIASLSQQSEIQSLEIQQKNLGIAIATVVILLFALVIYFIYRQRSLQKERAQTSLEQRFLRSQLNPHFIFNALMAIQNFMMKNDAPKASIYLAKFSKLMRVILENSREEFIPVSSEIEMLKNYLDIHQLRLNDSFDYQVHIDDRIEADVDTIPPMFVQPFVENAIEHGIVTANGRGLIVLNFSKQGEYISIEIRDNGGGLNIANTQPAEHKSLATTIIQERMALINKTLKDKIQLIIADIRNETGEIQGTRVELRVPFG